MGQMEDWSVEQKRLLAQLGEQAKESDFGTVAERAEVADALKRGMHKLSLRQGVLRLLKSLGLEHLKGPWDALYIQRSTLVHGLAPKPGAVYHELAAKTVSLCGQILLNVVAKEIPDADLHVASLYELQ